MLKVLIERLRQGHRTIAWPDGPPPALPGRYRGKPELDPSRCRSGCQECAQACPTGALLRTVSEAGDRTGAGPGRDGSGDPPRPSATALDLGRCLFCGDCARVCPDGAIAFSGEFRMAVREREHLILGPRELELAKALDAQSRRLLGRSLQLRQVSAGGCNACEADVNVLNTVVFDLGRFGIQFVASPRHADGLLITGPVTRNMSLALEKTYAATPEPRLVIAVGACAISGGPYIGHPESCDGAASVVPVDLYVPGCPPHPLTILDGLLRLLGRLPAERIAGAAG